MELNNMSNFLAHPLPDHKRPSFSRESFVRRLYRDRCDDNTVEQLRYSRRSYERQIRALRQSAGADLMDSSASPASVNYSKCFTSRIRPSPSREDVEIARFVPWHKPKRWANLDTFELWWHRVNKIYTVAVVTVCTYSHVFHVTLFWYMQNQRRFTTIIYEYMYVYKISVVQNRLY